MDLRGLRATVSEANFAVNGVPATVTIPDGAPVVTRAAQLRPTTQTVPGGGSDFRRSERRAAYAFPRADIPTLPRGSVVELLDTAETWRVDAIEDPSDQFHAVVLVPYVVVP